ncbi:protein-disulfide reductase DsbD domain-containing protein [Frateuria aurantia]
MRRPRTLPLMLALMACPALLQAGTSLPDPVQWSTPQPQWQGRAGQPLTVVLHAEIQPGWHLYALNEPDGGPHATEIGVAQGDAPDVVSVSEDPPVERFDPVMSRRLRFHLGQADFTLQLSLPAGTAPGPQHVHLLTRFQACSDRLCLPPRTRSVDTIVQVHAA